MSNILHVGLILIITKVFTILCLLCLCRNREYPGNFQNETIISKLFFQMSVQVKSEVKPTDRGNVNCYKSVHHPIPTLPVGTGSTLSIFKINQ